MFVCNLLVRSCCLFPIVVLFCIFVLDLCDSPHFNLSICKLFLDMFHILSLVNSDLWNVDINHTSLTRTHFAVSGFAIHPLTNRACANVRFAANISPTDDP